LERESQVVIVGGCGHVGLPLGIVLAERNIPVVLLDIDPSKVELVNGGKMPFREDGSQAILQRVIHRTLCATLDHECLRNADVVITVVGTPVDRHLNPTVHELYKNVDSLLSYIHDGTLLIL
jgi:UDP-N-acetyl-D-mannosaminuronic acid dehydrogenase